MANASAFDPVFTGAATATGQTYTLTVTLFNSGVPCAPPIPFTLNVLDATIPGLTAIYNGSGLLPVFAYGNDFPVFAICDDPPPANATIDFTDVSQPSPSPTFSINWGNNNTTAPPWSQPYSGPGLDTITYVATDPQSGCVTTAQFGVLIGSTAIPPSISATPFGGNEHCVGDSVFVEITDATPDPPGTMYVVYTNEQPPIIAVDTLFTPLPATYGYVFNQPSCGFTQAPYTNTYSVTLVPSYGCFFGSPNSSVAVPIYVSSSVTTSISVLPDDTVCVSEPVVVNAQNNGQWIDVNGLSSTCHPPNFIWTISPGTAGVDWNILPNALGSAGVTPNDPTTWVSGFDPLNVVFNVPGVYTVTIDAGGLAACGQGDDDVMICVEAPPIAAFTLDQPPVCYAGVPIILGTHDNSVPNATCSIPEYLWTVQAAPIPFCGTAPSIAFVDPLNGPTSLEPDISVNGPGIYTVTLAVSNEGCGPDVVDTIFTIYGPPSIDPIVDQPLCDGTPLQQVTAIAQGCEQGGLVITWDYFVGAVATSSVGSTLGPLVVDAPQTITVTAVSTQCGSAITTFDVTAQSSPASVNAAAQSTSLCDNAPLYLLADTIVGATYSWSGPGSFASTDQDPVVLPIWLPGIYTVFATLNGCDGPPTNVNITAQLTPVVNAPGGVLCPGEVTVPLAASGALSYVWFNAVPDTVSVLPSYAAGAGTYTVVGTGANGCTDTMSVTVTADNALASFAAPDTSCVGTLVNFYDTSVGVVAWSWDFEDLPSSTLQNPTHIFNIAGTYNVSLTGNPNGDCPLDTMITIVINAAPNMSMTLSTDTVCDGDLIHFANTSNPVPTSFTWSVNTVLYDDIDPPDQSFSTTPGIPAEIAVSLSGTTPGCAQSDTTATIVINPDPIAQLGYSWVDSTACSPFDVLFTNISLANGSVIDSLDFGDGSSTLIPFPNGAPVIHTYTTDLVVGNYTAYLYTNNDCGASIDSVHITVLPPLVSAFFDPPVAVCQDSTVQFNSLAVGATSWQWLINGTPSNLENPQYTFGASGTFPVQLTVSGPCGSDTWMDSVVVHSPPNAAFSIADGQVCLGTAVQVTSVTLGMGTYVWDFDGVPSTLTLPTHTFTTSGNHPITLNVTDQQTPACSADTQVVVQVNDTSIVAITAPPPGCAPFTASFTTVAQFTSSYQWSFGDGGTSVLPNPVHQYDSAGTYLVTLLSTNADSCGSVQSISVTALPTPVPGFTMTVLDSCTSASAPVVVQFNDASEGVGAWQWDLGVGPSNDPSPSASYTAPATYLITQTVTNAALCDSSMTLELTLYPEPEAAFEVLTDPACLYQPVYFDEGSQNFELLEWSFGDGHDTTGLDVAHSYDAVGTYTVVLVVHGQGACNDTVQATITVCDAPVADFTIAWEGPLAQFTNLSLRADSYLWSFGDGSTSSEKDPRHTFGFAPACIRTITLVAYNSCACTDSLSRTESVAIEPVIYVANTMTCNNDGTNDLFRPDFPKNLFADVDVSTYRFVVYDRWDHPLFDSGDPYFEWNGTFPDGSPVPTGVYNWTLEFQPPCRPEAWRKQGHVTLLR